MLSQNDKILFGQEILEDCEIFVEKFVEDDGFTMMCSICCRLLYFRAVILSQVSKVPERYQDLPIIDQLLTEVGDIHGIFDVTFVSYIFTLASIVSNSNF